MPSMIEDQLINEVTDQFDSVQPFYENTARHGLKSALTDIEEIEPASRTVTDPTLLTQYTINTMNNELPVIGTFVDENITPGFYYRVRRIHDSSFLFNGEARRLVSVGMGYGKRITFGGDHVIDNTDFFFYSDTEQEGFGFIPSLPKEPRRFTMHDTVGRSVAMVHVTDVESTPVRVVTTRTESDIRKEIVCRVTCDIKLTASPHGIIPVESVLSQCVTYGVAIIKQTSNAKQSAELISINNVHVNGQSYTLLPAY